MVDEGIIKKTMETLRKSAGVIRRNLNVGDLVFNASKTAEEKALNGKPWIEYWQTMTGKKIPKFAHYVVCHWMKRMLTVAILYFRRE